MKESNKKKYITKETSPIQTQDRTLSITPNLVFAEAHQFNRVFDEDESRIVIDINNFKEGKGENAKHFKFNLTLEQFYGLKSSLDSGYIFFVQPKFDFYVDYSMFGPEKDGAHQGETKFRKMTVEYKQGKNYPIAITITVGYKGADGKTTTSEFGYINLAYQTYAYLINKIANVIDIHKMIYAGSGIVTTGYKMVKEEEEKRKAANKGNNVQPTSEPVPETYVEPVATPVAEVPQTAPEPQAIPQQTAPAPQQQTASAPQKTDIHAVEGIFISDFQALSNSYVAKFRMENGREYDIHFKEVPEELRTAKEIESRVMINIYAYGDNIIFDSLV